MFYILTFQHSFLPTDTNSWNYITLVLKNGSLNAWWQSLQQEKKKKKKKNKLLPIPPSYRKTGTIMHHKTGH